MTLSESVVRLEYVDIVGLSYRLVVVIYFLRIERYGGKHYCCQGTRNRSSFITYTNARSKFMGIVNTKHIIYLGGFQINEQ